MIKSEVRIQGLLPAIYILAALTPVVIIGQLVRKYAVNLPIIDAWGMYLVPFVRNSLSQGDWEYFWFARNRGINRKFIPMVLGAIVLNLTNFNLKAIILVVLLLHLLGVFILYRIFVHVSGKPALYMLPVFAVSFISMSIWPYWTQPIYLEGTLMVVSLLGTIYFLVSWSGWRAIGAAIASASIGSLSFFGGNLTWLFAPILLLMKEKRDFRYLAAWLVPAAGFFILFLSGYQSVDHPRTVLFENISIYALFLFVSSFIGGPFIENADLAFTSWIGFGIISAFLLSIYLLLRYQQNGIRRAAPWTVIGLWVLANAVFAALGRGVDGTIRIQEALQPRYAFYGTLFFTNLVALLLTLIRGAWKFDFGRLQLGRYFNYGICALLIGTAGMHLFFISGRSFDKAYLLRTTKESRKAYSCVQEYLVVENDCFGRIGADVNAIRIGIAHLFLVGTYPVTKSDLPIDFVLPKNSMTSVQLPEPYGLMYEQAVGLRSQWLVNLPPLQKNRIGGDPLDGIWLETASLTQNGPNIFSITVRTLDGNNIRDGVQVEVESGAKRNIHMDLTAYAGSQIYIEFEVQRSGGTGPGYWAPPHITYIEPIEGG